MVKDYNNLYAKAWNSIKRLLEGRTSLSFLLAGLSIVALCFAIWMTPLTQLKQPEGNYDLFESFDMTFISFSTLMSITKLYLTRNIISLPFIFIASIAGYMGLKDIGGLLLDALNSAILRSISIILLFLLAVTFMIFCMYNFFIAFIVFIIIMIIGVVKNYD